MNLSDCEEMAVQRVQMKKIKKQDRRDAGQKAKASKYYVEVDTNVFEIQLDCLNNKTEIATGDPELCQGCSGVLNFKSQVKDVNNEQVWKCEFCNHDNKVMLDEEEIPKTEAVSYLVEAAAQVEDKKLGGQDISVIFCLDVSGSMCVTEPIKGKFSIKGDRRKDLNSAFAQFGDGSDQFINQSEKNVTYVSRLQCVQAAVQSQIEQM